MVFSRLPLPSFTLVLTSDRTLPPGPPVIRELIENSSPMLPTAPAHLMKTIDLRDDDADDTYFAYFKDNLGTNVDDDTETIFEEKRPATARGMPNKRGMTGRVVKFDLDSVSLLRKCIAIFKDRVPHTPKKF